MLSINNDTVMYGIVICLVRLNLEIMQAGAFPVVTV